MSDAAQTASNLAGLALAGTIVALSWPAARKYFMRWTWPQRLKFVIAIVLYVAFGLLPIPFLLLSAPRNAAGQAPAAAAGGAVLVMLGWVFLAVLLLLRYLMDEPQPKWVRHFSAAHAVSMAMVAGGVGIILFVRYG